MTGEWIPIDRRTYKCSICGGELMTSYPIEQWTRCPFCKAQMTVQKEGPEDGDLHGHEEP